MAKEEVSKLLEEKIASFKPGSMVKVQYNLKDL